MKTFKNRPYPLCDEPVKEFEKSRELGKQNKKQLTELFKSFGEVLKTA